MQTSRVSVEEKRGSSSWLSVQKTTQMNREQSGEETTWRSEKCAGGGGEHFTHNFLLSGEEEIGEKKRSERFQVEHWRLWASTQDPVTVRRFHRNLQRQFQKHKPHRNLWKNLQPSLFWSTCTLLGFFFFYDTLLFTTLFTAHNVCNRKL